MANSFLQVRVDEQDKEKASEILEKLGTNLSTVVNMLLRQIILTESIPFDISLEKNKPPRFRTPKAVLLASAQAAAYDSYWEEEAGRNSGPSSSDSDPDPVMEGIRREYDWV